MTMNLRIRRKKHLESAIKNKSVYVVASYATTNAVGCFQQHRIDVVLLKYSGSSEASKATANDDNI